VLGKAAELRAYRRESEGLVKGHALSELPCTRLGRDERDIHNLFFFFLNQMGCISTPALRVILIVPPTLRTPVDYHTSPANLDYKLANNMTTKMRRRGARTMITKRKNL
jgi:hypothetical protein